MAHHGVVCLRDRGLPRPPRLAASAARHPGARCALHAPVPLGAGGDSGNQHFAVPFFLAGGGRSGRGAGHGAAHRLPAPGATDAELRGARNDTVTGMFYSNFVMYFIILTTAATLHAHGITRIETASQAAEALRPLA